MTSEDEEILTKNETLDSAYRMMILKDLKMTDKEESMEDYLDNEYGVDYNRLENFYHDMVYGEGDRYKVDHEIAFSTALVFFMLGINFANMTNDLNLNFLNNEQN